MTQQRSYRKLYFWILLFQVAISLVLVTKFSALDFKHSSVVSFIGTNISIFALIIAILEILTLRNISQAVSETAEKTKIAISRFENVKDLGEAVSTISTIRDKMSLKEYGVASVLLNNLLKTYLSVIDHNVLLTLTSQHRKNTDHINSMISKFDILKSLKQNLSEDEISKFSGYLNEINQELIKLLKEKK